MNDILEKYEIPEGILGISSLGFQGNEHLRELIVPEGFTYIGSSAFCRCSGLKEITLPSSVNEIGPFAFEYCYELVIKAPAGSWAQQYAEENRYRYEVVK